MSEPVAAVREIGLGRPFHWLADGWEDLRRTALLSLVHGAAMAAFGGLLLWCAADRFWWLAGAFSGFLLVAPVLATGLYAASRAVERGEPADFALVWRIWSSLDRRLVAFGLLLAAAGTGWVLTSAALITLFAEQPVRTPEDFLRHVVLASRGWLFEVWLLAGGLMAAPVFASSVVAIPMLLDRRVGVLDAVLTSWRAVLTNPAPMALWAGIVMGLTLLGLGSFLTWLIVFLPLLGHASWHAYRELVGEPVSVRATTGNGQR